LVPSSACRVFYGGWVRLCPMQQHCCRSNTQRPLVVPIGCHPFPLFALPIGAASASALLPYLFTAHASVPQPFFQPVHTPHFICWASCCVNAMCSSLGQLAGREVWQLHEQDNVTGMRNSAGALVPQPRAPALGQLKGPVDVFLALSYC